MKLSNAITVMQAAAAGKRIQYQSKTDPSAKWTSTNSPKWDWADFDYRVAPLEPYPSVLVFLNALFEHSADWTTLFREDGDAYEVVNVDMEDNSIKLKLRDDSDYAPFWIGLTLLAEHYRFQDDTPCGYPTQD